MCARSASAFADNVKKSVCCTLDSTQVPAQTHCCCNAQNSYRQAPKAEHPSTWIVLFAFRDTFSFFLFFLSPFVHIVADAPDTLSDNHIGVDSCSLWFIICLVFGARRRSPHQHERLASNAIFRTIKLSLSSEHNSTWTDGPGHAVIRLSNDFAAPIFFRSLSLSVPLPQVFVISFTYRSIFRWRYGKIVCRSGSSSYHRCLVHSCTSNWWVCCCSTLVRSISLAGTASLADCRKFVEYKNGNIFVLQTNHVISIKFQTFGHTAKRAKQARMPHKMPPLRENTTISHHIEISSLLSGSTSKNKIIPVCHNQYGLTGKKTVVERNRPTEQIDMRQSLRLSVTLDSGAVRREYCIRCGCDCTLFPARIQYSIICHFEHIE